MSAILSVCWAVTFSTERMSIQTKLDGRLRRVWVTVLPDAQAATVVSVILQLVKVRPALTDWDWVVDLRNPSAASNKEELEQLVAVFNNASADMRYTVFISTDPGLYDWCARLGRMVGNRRHLVVSGMADAVRLLPAPMPTI